MVRLGRILARKQRRDQASVIVQICIGVCQGERGERQGRPGLDNGAGQIPGKGYIFIGNKDGSIRRRASPKGSADLV